jgi:hypothetical protein
MCDDLEAAGRGAAAHADSGCDPDPDPTPSPDCRSDRSAAGDGSDR